MIGTRSFHRTLASISVTLFTSAPGFALPPDGGIHRLEMQVAGKVIGVEAAPVRLPQPSVDNREVVAQLLKDPITNDAAVRIALLNNPDLQRALGRAGTGITDLQDSDTLAMRQAQVAITVLSARATQAWVHAVATAQSAATLRHAKETAEATGELARRMVQSGNLSKLNQAQYQVKLIDAAIALARAEQASFEAREQLIQVLGLWGEQTQFTLTERLPALPESPLDLPNLESLVLAAHPELGQLTADWQLKRRPPVAPNDLWDAMGDAAAVRAAAIKLRSQARQAYFNYRIRYDVAHQFQTHVLPMRQFIHDEWVLRYNGMLTSVFDVLADSQAQNQATHSATLAARDFWLAQTQLQALLAGAPLEALGIPSGSSNDEAPSKNSTAGH
jgi:outer membrane protein, multidrug efflux system